jgi:hypothetical protein
VDFWLITYTAVVIKAPELLTVISHFVPSGDHLNNCVGVPESVIVVTNTPLLLTPISHNVSSGDWRI